MKFPICEICQTRSVKGDAGLVTSIPYLYCKKCKIEVDEDGKKVETKPQLPPLYSDWWTKELEDPLETTSEEYRTVYDPFLKRNRRIKIDPPPQPKSELEEDDFYFG